jgi:NADH:ubiquinone oxidoreductase subunit 6 (subunit J)
MLLAIVLPVILGLIGVYLLLPRIHPYPMIWGAAASGVALLLAGFTLIRGGMAVPENLLFYCFSAIAIVTGTMLITQRNPVHAALSFAMVVLSTCGLFLLQAAPFLMAATTIVYAGAIVVTFLFVIMLAQQTGWSDADQRSREPFIATVAGFVLVGALLYLLQKTYDTSALDTFLRQAEAASQSDSPAAELGDEDEFLANLQYELEKTRGGPDKRSLLDEITNTRGEWKKWKDSNNFPEMRAALHRIAEEGVKVRDQIGSLQPQETTREHMSVYSVPPKDGALPENVAPLGRTLFTDYLLPVELGGTLLLVATIGAIAISGRRMVPPHPSPLPQRGEGVPLGSEGKP